jgi:hypothetical protein
MRDFSEEQLARVREALRGYHDRGEGGKGQYTWFDVWEQIAQAAANNHIELNTPPKSGAETLRRFVDGLDVKGETPRYPVPSAAVIQAILAFVSDNGL